MKKKIFIAIHYLEIGGAERALIGLLNALDYTKYEVDLFVYEHRGELMDMIPEKVNLLPEIGSYAAIEKPLKDAIKGCHIGIVIGRLLGKLKYYRYLKKNGKKSSWSIFIYIMKGVEPFLPSLKRLGKYDLAISFLTPHNIVLNKVCAKKKICWIHTDYSIIDINASLELPVWNGYDNIISIAPDVTKSFLKKFPSLENKIIEIENILSPTFIRNEAELISPTDIEKEMPHEQGMINLLSVGRFMNAKNFDNVPFICKKLLGLGSKVKWYLIGYGLDEALIQKRIQEAQMEDYVIIMGKKNNPYPYIKACDFYVQPSRYEGKSITVREAQILCKPVIITDYNTANSQVKNNIDGIIVPKDNDSCALGIHNFINNNTLKQKIITYLKSNDFGNEREIKKLYNITDNH